MLVSDSPVDSSCFEHSQPREGSWERSPPQAPYVLMQRLQTVHKIVRGAYSRYAPFYFVIREVIK